MENIGPRVSKMAMPCIWVATSPESTTRLSSRNASEGDAGYLATLTYRHTEKTMAANFGHE